MTERETRAALLAKARTATGKLRDYALEHGMHFLVRDPLVMDIHRALDLVALASSPSPEGETKADRDAAVALLRNLLSCIAEKDNPSDQGLGRDEDPCLVADYFLKNFDARQAKPEP
jgi:hypothetical protein